MKKVALALFLALFSSFALAIPQLLSVQGSLTEGGSPASGTKSMQFTLWTAASGGTNVWTETQPSVSVSNGVFNALLGSVTALPAFDADYWLEISVAGTTLSPRARVASAGYALSAKQLGNSSGAVFDTNTGNIGIDTLAPRAKLDVNGTLRLGIKTDDTTKFSGIIAEQYDSGTETEGWRVIHARSDSTSNSLRLGGSTAAENAATDIRFYTAADTTTLTGSERMQIDSAGNVGIGTTPSSAKKLNVGGEIRGTYLCCGHTATDGTGWVDYTATATNGIYIDVGTAGCSFPATPMYFTSLGGTSSHYSLSGATSIYTPTATGFRVYVRSIADTGGIRVANADSGNWYVQWCGIKQLSGTTDTGG